MTLFFFASSRSIQMMDESWNDFPLYTIYQNNIRKLRSNCGVTGQLIIYLLLNFNPKFYSFNSLQNNSFTVRMLLQPAVSIP